MRTYTPQDAWDGFVGQQTPGEFMAYSDPHQTIDQAVAEYISALKGYMRNDLIAAMPEPLTDEEIDALAAPLATSIREALDSPGRIATVETRKPIALQPITPYVSPQWLVRPLEPIAPDDLADEIASVVEIGFCVVDRTVIGWGDHNAIIALDDDAEGPGRYYLATLA